MTIYVVLLVVVILLSVLLKSRYLYNEKGELIEENKPISYFLIVSVLSNFAYLNNLVRFKVSHYKQMYFL